MQTLSKNVLELGEWLKYTHGNPHVYVFLYVYRHLRFHVCVHVFMYACMHACMYVCMYVCPSRMVACLSCSC